MRLIRRRPLAAVAAAIALLVTGSPPAAAAPPQPTVEANWTQLPGTTARKLDLNGPALSGRALSRSADTVSLTLKHLDDQGRLTPAATTALAKLDGSLQGTVEVGSGEVTLQLPKGRYLLAGVVRTGATDDPVSNFLVQPLLDLQADSTVELDARKAKPLHVTVDKAAVGSTLAALYFARRMDDGTMIQADLPVDRLNLLTAGQLGPQVPTDQLASSLATSWAVPGPKGDFADSPVTYNTLDTVRGRFFTGLERVARPKDMARVVSRMYSTAPGLVRFKSVSLVAPEIFGAWGTNLLHRHQQTVTEYVEPGAATLAGIQERPEDTSTSGPVTALDWSAPRTFAAGKRYGVTWNKAVLGPDLQDFSASRYGDLVSTAISMFSDQAGNAAWGTEDTASTKLFQDGKLVTETDRPGSVGRDGLVTPGRSSFRLESHVDRSELTNRSTTIDAAWTFQSDTASEAGEPLPLWVLRFQPDVDLRNEGRADALLPFTLNANPGAKTGRPRLPVVQVSGDRGKTWQAAYVVPKGGGRYLAGFALPAGVRTVSVRAQASDSAGNSVEQTIVDAYAVR